MTTDQRVSGFVKAHLDGQQWPSPGALVSAAPSRGSRPQKDTAAGRSPTAVGDRKKCICSREHGRKCHIFLANHGGSARACHSHAPLRYGRRNRFGSSERVNTCYRSDLGVSRSASPRGKKNSIDRGRLPSGQSI